MELTLDPQPPPRRLTGLVIVVALHLLLGYAIVSGIAGEAIDFVKKPLATRFVVELPKLPPPPPPPPKEIVKAPKPKVEAPPPPFVPPPEVAAPPTTAPTITAVTAEPPKAEYKIEAPPPPPAPVPAPAPAGPVRSEMSVACPTQVRPEVPNRAVQDGISGKVRAQVHIVGGEIKEVTILSGPKVFHAAVKTALSQYRCSSSADDVIAVQDFEFDVQ